MLETMRAAGSQYIVFPSTAFWWLDHYAGLRRHLQDNYHLIGSQRDSLIFALGMSRRAFSRWWGQTKPRETRWRTS